jgi:tRNA (cmo5U34)-methyltransferase
LARRTDHVNHEPRETPTVGDGISAPNAAWTFADGVATTFSQHVRRSVPLYDVGHDLVCQLSDFFVRGESVCYEIGVSCGDLLGKLAQHNATKGARWVGLDVEPSMIEKARENLSGNKNVSLHVADAVHYEFERADFIVSYYSLQFVPPKWRQQLLTRLYDSLNWGGALVLFEKVRACDARFQDIMTLLYSEFKLRQQFTPEEILAKSRSLKGVLEPFSTQANIDLLKRAGFVDVMSVMKYVSFEGFVAIK